jgi:hypothetical protein
MKSKRLKGKIKLDKLKSKGEVKINVKKTGEERVKVFEIR